MLNIYSNNYNYYNSRYDKIINCDFFESIPYNRMFKRDFIEFYEKNYNSYEDIKYIGVDIKKGLYFYHNSYDKSIKTVCFKYKSQLLNYLNS